MDVWRDSLKAQQNIYLGYSGEICSECSKTANIQLGTKEWKCGCGCLNSPQPIKLLRATFENPNIGPKKSKIEADHEAKERPKELLKIVLDKKYKGHTGITCPECKRTSNAFCFSGEPITHVCICLLTYIQPMEHFKLEPIHNNPDIGPTKEELEVAYDAKEKALKA